MEDTSRKIVRKNLICPKTMAQRGHENTLDSSVNLKYDELEIIFRYLSGWDLENATMVCRSWLEVANAEKQKRRDPCYCLINLGEVDNFLSYTKNIRIKPLIAFFFICSSRQNCTVEERHSIESYIQNFLSKHCEVIMLYSFGIFMVNSDSETQFDPHIISVFLPQIPNVRIETYIVTEYCDTVWNEINTNARETFKSNHETSTSFIFFSNYSGSIRAKKFISYMQKRKTFKISSLLHIVLEDIYLLNKMDWRIDQRMGGPKCIAVMITGPIETWSVILEKNCTRNIQEQIEARLQLFKDEIKLKKHSLGFIFLHTCNVIDLNRVLYITIFKRLFPKTSFLIGCFVEHVVDYSNVGKTAEVNEEKNDEDEMAEYFCFDFDIMFLILTYD